MPYVMVPVPAEHEEELIQEILKLGVRQSMASWEQDQLAKLLDEVEPQWRRLLVFLAGCHPEQPHPPGPDIAAHLGVDESELFPLGLAINAHCKAQGWPVLVLTKAAEAPSAGQVETMWLDVAVAAQLIALLADPEATPATD